MKKMKVVTIVGTRPEIIRLSRVLAKLDQYFEHYLIHTGQNYDFELNEIFFRDLSLKHPSHYLNAAGSNPMETVGKIISETDKILEQLSPDAVLILGDTNSCLAALPAKRRKIPVFHMEAGNRCFDLRVPEEINRRIVDHIADVNLPYSDIAREYLIREGMPPDRVIKTGSPMFEVLDFYKNKISSSTILNELSLVRGEYFLASAHREENVDNPEKLRAIIGALEEASRKYAKPIIMTTHPRTRKRVDELGIKPSSNLKLIKPLGFIDYVALQIHAAVVISDSGTISEESSILQFPALNIRDAHERPEAFEESGVIMTGLSTEGIMQSLDLLFNGLSKLRGKIVADYNIPDVSDKIIKIIQSYTPYVNRVVWARTTPASKELI